MTSQSQVVAMSSFGPRGGYAVNGQPAEAMAKRHMFQVDMLTESVEPSTCTAGPSGETVAVRTVSPGNRKRLFFTASRD